MIRGKWGYISRWENNDKLRSLLNRV
jgi:hypothetical protein